jgi:hypothetical protein
LVHSDPTSFYPEASEILDRIAQLYAIEAEAKRASPEERLAGLAALRAKQSKSVLDEIRTWLMTQRALPRSALSKAIAYTSGLWAGLVRFLGDPKIPLDPTWGSFSPNQVNLTECVLSDTAKNPANFSYQRAGFAGDVRIIDSIEDPAVIRKILTHS